MSDLRLIAKEIEILKLLARPHLNKTSSKNQIWRSARVLSDIAGKHRLYISDHELDHLVALKLVEAATKGVRVYAITDLGRQELRKRGH